jgi:hypothetical protein
MPKEAARIFLRVKDVRAERLQDITNEDAIKEGACDEPLLEGMVPCGDEAVCDFAAIWRATIRKEGLERYGWAANPWVWVVEFEKMEVDADNGEIEMGLSI